MIPDPIWRPTIAEYHADRSHWSPSMLKVFRGSPRAAWERFVAQTVDSPAPSGAMILGTIANAALLEQPIYVAGCRTRRGKAWEEALKADPRAVSQDEADKGREIANAILEPRTPMARLARRLLLELPGHSEWAHRWYDGPTGVPCKALLDRAVAWRDRPCYVELKTTTDPSPAAFGRQAWNLDYHCQAAHNLEGLRLATGGDPLALYVAVRNEPPHEVHVCAMPEVWVSLGQRQIDDDYRELARMLELPPDRPWWAPWEELMGEEQEIPNLEVPPWAA